MQPFDFDKSRLILGDCIDVMKTIQDDSIDFIVADPPYKLEMPKKSRIDDLKKSKNINRVLDTWDVYTLDDYLAFTEAWLQQAFRILKETGSIAIFGSYHNIGLINYILQKNKWLIINDIAWYKRNAVPNLYCRRLTASFETILWVNKHSHKYTFNYQDLKDGDFPEDGLKKPNKQMRNVWDIPTASNENVGHPTQKPTKVYERLIKMAVRKDENSIILDPFAGSGTLGVVANQLHFYSILIEKDPRYFEIIQKRLGSINRLRFGPHGAFPMPSKHADSAS
jgi:site-specific DNA-methyltransferase (adenine-specific)